MSTPRSFFCLSVRFKSLTLTVDKSFRRSGHASRLLSAVADLTSGQLRVWVGVDDEERQRFYTSAGFAPSGAVRVMGDGPTQHMWWAERD